MVALAARRRPNLTLAPLAVLAGLAAMLGAWALPVATLQAIAIESRIAAPAMRMAVALLAGLAVAGGAWLMLRNAGGPSRVVRVVRVAREARSEDTTPVLRRADAHPDAPPRPPLRAALDLGTPFLDVRAAPLPPAERAVPRDLNQPLSAYDPGAILDNPLAPPEPVAPLRRREPQAALHRYARFQILDAAARGGTSPAEPAEPPMVAPETDATIHALLDRLERGMISRGRMPAASRPDRSLDEALAELRRMAARR